MSYAVGDHSPIIHITESWLLSY